MRKLRARGKSYNADSSVAKPREDPRQERRQLVRLVGAVGALDGGEGRASLESGCMSREAATAERIALLVRLALTVGDEGMLRENGGPLRCAGTPTAARLQRPPRRGLNRSGD